MAGVKIVTDSGADIPKPLAEELDIAVVPLTVHFGDEEFKDGVDLELSEFYRRLHAGGQPRTTQPSPTDFEAVYRRLQADADAIVSVHLSSELSGTMQSASIAAAMDGIDVPVHVVDSRSASLGIGMLAVEAARMAKAGASAEDIVQHLEAIVARQKVLFLVDTLEYLQRNGRIGRAQAFVGGLLNIKPLLTIDDGVVAPLERARGRAKARARLLELVTQGAQGQRVKVAVMHADALEEAESLASELRSRLDVEELVVGQLGATIGTHAGPGTLGVVFYSV
ncbi:MAG: DegV family protein [Limnochordales bacterium]|nr:MAG: DegV family protein [Bacillota bacterium]